MELETLDSSIFKIRGEDENKAVLDKLDEMIMAIFA